MKNFLLWKKLKFSSATNLVGRMSPKYLLPHTVKPENSLSRIPPLRENSFNISNFLIDWILEKMISEFIKPNLKLREVNKEEERCWSLTILLVLENQSQNHISKRFANKPLLMDYKKTKIFLLLTALIWLLPKNCTPTILLAFKRSPLLKKIREF